MLQVSADGEGRLEVSDSTDLKGNSNVDLQYRLVLGRAFALCLPNNCEICV